MLYAGIDAHKKNCQMTLVDERGSLIRRRNFPSTPEGFQTAFAEIDQPVKATFEASFCWGKIYDLLDNVADEVILAHPAQLRAIAHARIKTDKLDADKLAQLLRGDLIPAAYAAPKPTRAAKRILRQRMFYVRLRTMVKNRVTSLISQHHLTPPAVSDPFGLKGTTWLKEQRLDGADQELLTADLNLLDEMKVHIQDTDGMIEKLALGDEAIVWLKSLPGIGKFFSVLIHYKVDQVERFPSASKFASYTGLVPSTYASADRLTHGRLTKQGNKYLRWAFVEAVHPRSAVRSGCNGTTSASKTGAAPRTQRYPPRENWPSWPGRCGGKKDAMKNDNPCG